MSPEPLTRSIIKTITIPQFSQSHMRSTARSSITVLFKMWMSRTSSMMILKRQLAVLQSRMQSTKTPGKKWLPRELQRNCHLSRACTSITMSMREFRFVSNQASDPHYMLTSPHSLSSTSKHTRLTSIMSLCLSEKCTTTQLSTTHRLPWQQSLWTSSSNLAAPSLAARSATMRLKESLARSVRRWAARPPQRRPPVVLPSMCPDPSCFPYTRR